MTNDKSKESRIFPIKKLYQNLVIIFIVIISISILFYNASHNFPSKANTETFLTWSVSQVIILFGVMYISSAIFSLLIINTKNSSLKEFLKLKNFIILFMIFVSISIINYSFSLIGNTLSLVKNLSIDFALISVLFIILFIITGIFFLIILNSTNKKQAEI